MLEGRAYVPLLHARLAEIRALRELPDITKNLLFPIIKLRPWLNAKSLDKALEVIEGSIGNRLYAVDLDATKYELNPSPEKPARVEFSQLFDPTDGYRSYYDLVESGPNRVPVFQGINTLNPQVSLQLDQIEELDRGIVVRTTPSQPGSILVVATEIAHRQIGNAVFVIDCGWGRDILGQSALCAFLVQRLVDISPYFEIVVGGSSFPDSFRNLGDRFEIRAVERPLFQEVRRQVNGGTLVYGDWGSTRPPSDPTPVRNVPRIDIALPFNWVCWRSNGGENYQDLALRALEDPQWDGSLGIWGEYMIESTATGADGSIKSPAMAAAVRVNLHMHQQANFDNPDALHVGDEIVGEDL